MILIAAVTTIGMSSGQSFCTQGVVVGSRAWRCGSKPLCDEVIFGCARSVWSMFLP